MEGMQRGRKEGKEGRVDGGEGRKDDMMEGWIEGRKEDKGRDARNGRRKRGREEGKEGRVGWRGGEDGMMDRGKEGR
jgi:hypothetical protein